MIGIGDNAIQEGLHIIEGQFYGFTERCFPNNLGKVLIEREAFLQQEFSVGIGEFQRDYLAGLARFQFWHEFFSFGQQFVI
jgi:hypothetical protein